VGDFGGENGYMRRILEGNEINGGNYHSIADTAGPLDVSRIFVSSGVPERASKSQGWPGLAEWMKAQFQTKTRNRGRSWAEYRHPDLKMACRGSRRGYGWRCSYHVNSRISFTAPVDHTPVHIWCIISL
jgi:hypothetical protein